MTDEKQKFYKALIEKNSEYYGIFSVGAKTTKEGLINHEKNSAI